MQTHGKVLGCNYVVSIGIAVSLAGKSGWAKYVFCFFLLLVDIKNKSKVLVFLSVKTICFKLPELNLWSPLAIMCLDISYLVDLLTIIYFTV